MAEIIAEFEGFKAMVYEDTKGIKTVGYGFNMEQSNAREIFEKYVNKSEVSFDDVLSGKKKLTREQALALFKGTMDEKIKLAKRLFPNFDKYPEAVKTALVNGVYRGEFKASHKTVKYINKGQWDKVADEYLDRDDYRNSKPGKNGGIKIRMDFNAKIFREYAKLLKCD